MDCVMVSGVPSRNRRLMMSLAGTSSASASSATVTPWETRTASSPRPRCPGRGLLDASAPGASRPPRARASPCASCGGRWTRGWPPRRRHGPPREPSRGCTPRPRGPCACSGPRLGACCAEPLRPLRPLPAFSARERPCRRAPRGMRERRGGRGALGGCRRGGRPACRPCDHARWRLRLPLGSPAFLRSSSTASCSAIWSSSERMREPESRGRHRAALRLELLLAARLASRARAASAAAARAASSAAAARRPGGAPPRGGLGGQALGLLLAGALGLLGSGGLLLGTRFVLELGGALLEHRRELLAHHLDVGVLERRRRGLGGDLHLVEMVESSLDDIPNSLARLDTRVFAICLHLPPARGAQLPACGRTGGRRPGACGRPVAPRRRLR